MLVSIVGALQAPGHAASLAMERLLETVRSTTQVRVKSTVRLEAREGRVIESSESRTSIYLLDAPRRGLLLIGDWRWLVTRDQLVIEHVDDASAYVRQEHGGTPLEAVRSTAVSMPDPYLALAMGDSGLEGVCRQLHDVPLGLVPVVIEQEGRQIRLEGEDSTLVFALDEQGRPTSGTLDRRNVSEGIDLRWNWTWSYAPVLQEELEAALNFDRRGRQRIDSPRAFRIGSNQVPVELESSPAGDGRQ